MSKSVCGQGEVRDSVWENAESPIQKYRGVGERIYDVMAFEESSLVTEWVHLTLTVISFLQKKDREV